MKICYFSDARSIHIKRWIEYFNERGHDVYLISVAEGEIEGAKVYNLNLFLPSTRNVIKRPLSALKTIVKIKSIIRKISPDIVHIHYLYNSPLVFAFKSVKNLIVTTWGSDINPYQYGKREPMTNRLYKKFILKEADAITSVSSYLARVTRGYTCRKEVEVIPFGVDLSLFKPREKKSDRGYITVSFIKWFKPVYGGEFFIDAIPKVLEQSKSIRFLLIGSGPQERRFKNLVDELKISNFVRFISWVPHKEIVKWLSLTDIFVMPSLSEGCPVIAMEAQSMEVPVVATRVGGVPEVVKDGHSGILVEPEDSSSLAEAIIKLVKCRGLRIMMGRNGRKFIQKRFDWKQNARQMENLYERIIR